ncbi:NUDIX domain-containing protein [Candidatus Woesebacteria bacterium]|nr:NUDIX domain-containing protein [Candidatus Woesebacteria bacterium]MCD8506778.1 NUDIX domain-containing protein [Candidatus Woesebacteria bacterium]MCD8527687.1 NUDIX domain-containing protein [Candidatus Woesebacteria bacterium]MCD8546344.1 NUDIX domain-containing protein [Candidatus Woesebacteria bacterium]
MHAPHSRLAVYLVLKQNDTILLLQRQNTGYEDGNYGLVSGHVEPGESFQTALQREAKEEASIEIQPQHILATHIQHRKSTDAEYVDAYFLVEKWSGTVSNCEPEKCSALVWHAIDALPENTIPGVRLAVEHLFEGSVYSEIGW